MSKSSTRRVTSATVAENLEAFERIAKEVRNELGRTTEVIYGTACELTNNVMRFEAKLSAVADVLKAASEAMSGFREYADKLYESSHRIFDKVTRIEALTALSQYITNVFAPELAKYSAYIRRNLDKLADGKSSQTLENFLVNGMYIQTAVEYSGLKNFSERIDQKVDELMKEIDEVFPEIRNAREMAKATGWPKVAAFLQVSEELLATYKEDIEQSALRLKQMSRELDTTKIVKLKETIDRAIDDLKEFTP